MEDVYADVESWQITGRFLRREAASSPLAGEIESLDPGTRMELIEDLNESLHDYVDDHGVIFPMETFMISANK